MLKHTRSVKVVGRNKIYRRMNAIWIHWAGLVWPTWTQTTANILPQTNQLFCPHDVPPTVQCSSGAFFCITNDDKDWPVECEMETSAFSDFWSFVFIVPHAAASVVSSHGPTSATREHEKRILESILPPDLRHLVRGGSSGTLQVGIHFFYSTCGWHFKTYSTIVTKCTKI